MSLDMNENLILSKVTTVHGQVGVGCYLENQFKILACTWVWTLAIGTGNNLQLSNLQSNW